MKTKMNTRRKFIKNIFSGGAGVAALSSLQLQLMNSAFAQTAPSDYKALVCVFLFGGNDSFNMLVPMRGDVLNEYHSIRGNLARSNAREISPLNQEVEGGIGFVEEMPELAQLFDDEKLAIQANVGALVEPILENGIVNPNARKPVGLFAHDASQQNWQRGADLNEYNSGWAGRVMDLLHGTSVDANSFLRSVSFSNANLWQTGQFHSPYALSAQGLEKLKFYLNGHLSHIRQAALNQYVQNYQSNHILQQAFGDISKQAVNNNRSVSEQLNGLSELVTAFPANNSLADQLKMVTKLIQIGKARGLSRQVFFVGMGGFDTHNNQNSTHPQLLRSLSQALGSFYNATEEMQVSEQVTSFTMSDFGRKLSSNGDGTDHGWTGHQMIMGGAVQGGVIHGDIPIQSRDMSLVPTTSNEQMFASLAKWLGLPSTALSTTFPNLTNFSSNIEYF